MPHDQEQDAAIKAASVKTILVVEDDSDIATFLSLAIGHETSYHPLVVPDGFEALRVMQHIKPNLLIIDYHLPGMTGIELYDHLHSQKELEAIPAIILSASLARHEEEIKVRKLVGMSKPLELSEFLTTLGKLLS